MTKNKTNLETFTDLVNNNHPLKAKQYLKKILEKKVGSRFKKILDKVNKI